MIDQLTNPQHSVLPNKWQFNTSQDWEILGDDFDSVSSELIPNTTLQALSFHHSLLGYLEEQAPRFVDVTDKPELTIKPEDNDQPITDTKDEKEKKGLKCNTKRKAQCDNLYVLMRQAFAASSTAPLLSRSTVLVLLSHLPISALSYPLVLVSLSPPLPALLSLLVPTLLSRSMLGPTPTHLTSSVLRIFKRALSDELLHRHSTSPSPIEPFCPFSTLGQLPKKNNRNRFFNTAFIISCPLARNHAANELDLSFAECGCPTLVKLNQLWELELLDCKPVCIMEVTPLTAILFWDLLFVFCLRHTMKLTSKLGLRTRSIASEVIKEKIELVWANRTIRQLDHLL